MRIKRTLQGVLVALVVAIALPGAAQAAVTLQPGAYHETDAGSCTLNFSYAGNGKTYLGTAAHCVASIGQTVRDIDGTTFEPCVSREEYDRMQLGAYWHGRTDR